MAQSTHRIPVLPYIRVHVVSLLHESNVCSRPNSRILLFTVVADNVDLTGPGEITIGTREELAIRATCKLSARCSRWNKDHLL